VRLLTNNHGEASIGNINGLFSYIKLPSDTLSEYSPSPSPHGGQYQNSGHVLNCTSNKYHDHAHEEFFEISKPATFWAELAIKS
jgi:hypothetical protein